MSIVQIQTSRSGIGSGSGTNTKAAGRYALAQGFGTKASGDYSTASGYASTASGNTSTASGYASTASGYGATASGYASTASGNASTASGNTSTASGNGATASGYVSTASGDYSTASGYASTASRAGQYAHAGGKFSENGDAQNSQFVMWKETTTATPTELALNGSTTYLTIGTKRTMSCEIRIAAHRTDVTGTAAAWPSIKAGITRDTSGNCRLLGTVVGDGTTTMCDAGAATWSVSVTASASNRLAITVTGEDSKTIRWVATVDMAEVG